MESRGEGAPQEAPKAFPVSEMRDAFSHDVGISLGSQVTVEAEVSEAKSTRVQPSLHSSEKKTCLESHFSMSYLQITCCNFSQHIVI